MTSNDDDNELWDKFAKEIKPLSAKDKNSVTLATKKSSGVQPPPPKPLKPAKPVKQVSSVTTKSFDIQTRRKITKGKKRIEAKLDLHGNTLEMARPKVLNFIEKARALDHRLVLIVTGKGKDGEGVLRKEVPRWLSQSPLVNSYEHASEKDGGSGALYVQVKRLR